MHIIYIVGQKYSLVSEAVKSTQVDRHIIITVGKETTIIINKMAQKASFLRVRWEHKGDEVQLIIACLLK